MLINPIDQEQEQWVRLFFLQYIATGLCDRAIAFKPYKLCTSDGNTTILFCYPLRPLSKILEEKVNHLTVYNLWEIGCGAYGQVYPVLGHWCFKGDKGRLRPKNDVIKMTWPHYGNNDSAAVEKNSIENEKEYGSRISYLGMRFPVQVFSDRFALQMHRLPGTTLYTILLRIKRQPDYLSDMQKHQLALSLLRDYQQEAMENKIVHRNIIPDNIGMEKKIVHRDIKADNIIVDFTMRQAHLIDWGLAKYIFANSSSLQARKKAKRSIAADLRAIMLCIAELYGYLSDKSYLLWENVDLTQEEKSILLTTILYSLHSDSKIRPPIKSLIERFEQLLDIRQSRLNDISSQILDHWQNNQQEAKEGFIYLQSHTVEELKRVFKAHKIEISKIIPQLDKYLWHLPFELLQFFKTEGVNFSAINCTILDQQLASGQLDSRQLQQWISLGVCPPGNALSQWIFKSDENIHGLYNWISVLRQLHQHPDTDSVKPELLALVDVPEKKLILQIQGFFSKNTPAKTWAHQQQEPAIAWHVREISNFNSHEKFLRLRLTKSPFKELKTLQQKLLSLTDTLSRDQAYPSANFTAMQMLIRANTQIKYIITDYHHLMHLKQRPAPKCRDKVLIAWLHTHFKALLQPEGHWLDFEPMTKAELKYTAETFKKLLSPPQYASVAANSIFAGKPTGEDDNDETRKFAPI